MLSSARSSEFGVCTSGKLQSSSPVGVQYPRGMRLLPPVLHSIVRAGRRIQAESTAAPKARAFSGRGVVCTPQVEFGAIVDVGSTAARKRKPTLSPSLTDVPKGGPLQAYAKLVLTGNIWEDKHQVKTLFLLQKVRVKSQVIPFCFTPEVRVHNGLIQQPTMPSPLSTCTGLY